MRFLSGIQPSGTLHLGNYFSSMKPNIECIGTTDSTGSPQVGSTGSPQVDQSFYFIADLHSLTTVHDPAVLRAARHEIILDYLACGFDPERSILYYQSQIPQHTELAWILSTVTPMGLLERAVSYKDKVKQGTMASVGLFTYPVLMAADILLYDADIVPVGRDQKQHVEIARAIAIKFNNAYGPTLTVPEPKIKDDVAVVPGTDGQKMSKSYGNTIPIFGEEKAIQKAIMGIVTDSKGVDEPKDPDTCTVYRIHRLFLSAAQAKVLADKYRAGGLGYDAAKKMLFQTSMDYFAGMRKKRAELEKKPKYLEEVIKDGVAKASKVAVATIDRVRKAVGLS